MFTGMCICGLYVGILDIDTDGGVPTGFDDVREVVGWKRWSVSDYFDSCR